MFSKLLRYYSAHSLVGKPTPDFIDRYRALVPPELLEFWEQIGFGVFCEGYLKIVNPDDYADLLADTYQLSSTPTSTPPLVLFATAMGDLLIWERGYLVLLDYRHQQTKVVSKGLGFFFQDLADEEMLSAELRWAPYPAARARLGEPAFDECFGYVPLLALGGPETVDHLQKVKLREHLYLISQFTGVLER